jgi:hypothetical protein
LPSIKKNKTKAQERVKEAKKQGEEARKTRRNRRKTRKIAKNRRKPTQTDRIGRPKHEVTRKPTHKERTTPEGDLLKKETRRIGQNQAKHKRKPKKNTKTIKKTTTQTITGERNEVKRDKDPQSKREAKKRLTGKPKTDKRD